MPTVWRPSDGLQDGRSRGDGLDDRKMAAEMRKAAWLFVALRTAKGLQRVRAIDTLSPAAICRKFVHDGAE